MVLTTFLSFSFDSGKHHMGDYLPPEVLRRFIQRATAVREGDEQALEEIAETENYGDKKLDESNIGR